MVSRKLLQLVPILALTHLPDGGSWCPADAGVSWRIVCLAESVAAQIVETVRQMSKRQCLRQVPFVFTNGAVDTFLIRRISDRFGPAGGKDRISPDNG